MKSTSVSTKIITILLLLAVIGYFAVQGYNYFVSPETTTLVYRYHSEESIALRGYVVRDEQVVDCTETLIELTQLHIIQLTAVHSCHYTIPSLKEPHQIAALSKCLKAASIGYDNVQLGEICTGLRHTCLKHR